MSTASQHRRSSALLTRSVGIAGVISLVSGSAGLLFACGGGPTNPSPPAPNPPADSSTPVAATPEPPRKPAENTSLDSIGLSSAAMDKSADPCDDFYQYACGGWINSTEIPSDKARWTRSFSEIDKRNQQDLKGILEAAIPKKNELKTDNGKLGAFYGSCMDETAINAAGIKPIQPLLTAVKNVRDMKTLEKTVALLHKHGVWAFFDVSNEQDNKDATKMIGVIDQNGLGLPDRDYYLSKDAEKAKTRTTYLEHVAAMLKLAGVPEKGAAKEAQDVVDFETALATIQKSREDRRDPVANYNKIDRDGAKRSLPSLDWDEYFKDIGFANVTELNVKSPKYLSGIDDLLKATKPEVLKSYLTWQVIHHSASLLSKNVVDEDFKMTKALTGQETQRDRWKRCVDATDGALGELLAKPFVELRFGGESKQAAESYVREIAGAFDSRVGELDWMDAATKEKAKAKLKAMENLIGYPAKWKNYEFKIGGAYGDNALAAAEWKFHDDMEKIGKPVDRGAWEMTPQTVNAYYDPQLNHMVFPAGILQPPFYSAKASVPVNLGAMGMVVGHELTHGFDDEGSQYDRNGNLANWWTPSVEEDFKGRGQCVVDQYGAYEVLPGVKESGKLTLGENIADVGGMKLAFRAYRGLRKDSPTEQIADGLNEDQQFFLATGQIWCSKYREKEARRLATIDPHSNPRFRVNGPMSQLPEFEHAFQCKPGAKMVSAKKCSVW